MTDDGKDRLDVPSYAELLQRTDAPPGSSWNVFGPGDEVGTLNFLTPSAIIRGADAVRTGAVFNLDYPIDAFPEPDRFRPAPVHRLHYLGYRDDGTYGPTRTETSVIDDYLDGFYLQASSQIDGLRHFSHSIHGLYSGVPRSAIVPGTPTIGINNWAERGIAGRGLLVDVAMYRDSIGQPLDHDNCEWIDTDLLEATLSAQRTRVLPGDMIVLRVGYPERLASQSDREAAHRSAGLAVARRTVAWLWDHQVPLIASDNLGVEPARALRPGEYGEGRDGTLHAQLIALLGMPLGELWKLDELADACHSDGVYEFQLVCSPLNVVGAAGTPANATAIR